MQDACLFDKLDHALCFLDVPRQRFLTGDPDELSSTCLKSADDLLHVIDSLMIGAADPKAIDVRRRDHLINRAKGSGLSHSETSCELRRLLGMRAIWAPHSKHIGISDTKKGLNMKSGDETAADEADSESLCHSLSPCFLCPAFLSGTAAESICGAIWSDGRRFCVSHQSKAQEGRVRFMVVSDLGAFSWLFRVVRKGYGHQKAQKAQSRTRLARLMVCL
jgi:hypothetical protein